MIALCEAHCARFPLKHEFADVINSRTCCQDGLRIDWREYRQYGNCTTEQYRLFVGSGQYNYSTISEQTLDLNHIITEHTKTTALLTMLKRGNNINRREEELCLCFPSLPLSLLFRVTVGCTAAANSSTVPQQQHATERPAKSTRLSHFPKVRN